MHSLESHTLPSRRLPPQGSVHVYVSQPGFPGRVTRASFAHCGFGQLFGMNAWAQWSVDLADGWGIPVCLALSVPIKVEGRVKGWTSERQRWSRGSSWQTATMLLQYNTLNCTTLHITTSFGPSRTCMNMWETRRRAGQSGSCMFVLYYNMSIYVNMCFPCCVIHLHIFSRVKTSVSMTLCTCSWCVYHILYMYVFFLIVYNSI